MNWIQRKIHLYNVTFGLYMLDWWERYLFNTLVIVLMWFIFYNGSQFVNEFCKRTCLVHPDNLGSYNMYHQASILNLRGSTVMKEWNDDSSMKFF